MSEDTPLLPTIGEDDAPFWAAARNHELRMQQCTDCGTLWWAPSSVCPNCWSESNEWVELAGTGTVNSWVIFHRPYWPAFEDDVPYNVAEITLDEGHRYLANVVECDNDALYRGMPVEVVFEDISDEITLPKFTPRESP